MYAKCTFCIFMLHHILPFLMHIPYLGIFWHILAHFRKKKLFFPKISQILSFQRTSRIRNLAYLWKVLFKWVKYTILRSNTLKTITYLTAYFPILGSIFAYIFRRFLVHTYFPSGNKPEGSGQNG